MSQTESNPVTVEIDTRIYRLTAVKKAAYKFGDRCHILIEPLPESAVRIILKPKRLLDSPTRLAGEFQNELLDQELREIIGAETEGVRNLIIAQAFSLTSLLDPQGESADYHEDPLGISRSDHQKGRGDSAEGKQESS